MKKTDLFYRINDKYFPDKSYVYVYIFSFLVIIFYLIYVLYIHPPWLHIYSDMMGYIERSSDMAKGDPLCKYDSFYPAGMTCLYTLFFIFFRYEYAMRIIAVFNVLLLVLNNYLVFLIIKNFFHRNKEALRGMIFSSLYLPFLLYAGFYLSEIPFAFFLLLSLYLFFQAFTDEKGTLFNALSAGLALGFASIIKGTLYGTLILLIFLLLIKYGRKFPWKKTAVFFAGVTVVLSVQVIHNFFCLQEFALLPTNGGINAYLGQAHIKRSENIHPEGHYFFYNNNSYFDKTLTEEKTFYFGVWEQDKYFEMVKGLWMADPWKQIKISVNNGIDLFRIIRRWPVRNDREIYGRLDVYFQYIFLILVYIPMLLYLFTAFVKKREKLFPLLIILCPVASVVISSMLSKGEPRYLLPFQYLFIIISCLFRWDIKNK